MKTVSILVLSASLLALPRQAGPSVNAAASIFPISSIVQEIAGSKATVTTILPPGADPHHFELTPRSARAIYDADVVFLIGSHFDEWVFGATTQDNEDGRFVELYKTFGDSLIPIRDSFNPHFWLDPLFARAMGTAVSAALSAIDSENRGYYEERASVFCSRIDSLHAATRVRVRKSGFRAFVSVHPAWSYFARRYGIDEVDTIEISHEQEPSARHITGVIAKMRTSATRFVVAEEFSNPDLAKAVATQTNAQVIYMDPIGGHNRPNRDSYFKLIDHNTSALETAVTARGEE